MASEELTAWYRNYSKDKGYIELAYRSFNPVVSFVKDKLEPVIVAKPDVGIRWGKPSEFKIEERQQKKYSGTIEYSEWLFWEIDIKDFTEQLRKFTTGEVEVEVPPLPTISTGEPWNAYVNALLDTLRSDTNRVELEEMRSFTFNSGLSYSTPVTEYDPGTNVTIYFEFKMEPQIPFIIGTREDDERGNHPNGEPIIPRIKSLAERQAEENDIEPIT